MTAPQAGGRALLLSGSIGSGHDVVAEVCADALAAAGMAADCYDSMALLGSWNARLGEAGFRWLLARAALYDAFYFSQLRAPSRFSRRGSRAASRRIADRLEKVAGPFADSGGDSGVEFVLSVFATGAAAGAELARRHPALRTAVFCTDATAHAMWVHPGTDLFIVTSGLGAASVRRYQPSARIAVVPPPVRAPFYAPPGRAQSRAALRVPDDRRCVLLTAGGWGVAPLASCAAALARAGFEVLAVAGSNAKLHGELRRLAAAQPGLLVFGSTGRMHELMAAADVVVTSPGQACHEARVVGRPLVLLDAVPGHGRETLLAELSRGGAIACSPGAESVRLAVEFSFRAPPDIQPWPVRSARQWQQIFLRALSPLGLAVRAARSSGQPGGADESPAARRPETAA